MLRGSWSLRRSGHAEQLEEVREVFIKRDHAASPSDEASRTSYPGLTLATASFDVQRAGVRARRREGR
jgi:hypothetical protein